jgi:hypothetical protein
MLATKRTSKSAVAHLQSEDWHTFVTSNNYSSTAAVCIEDIRYCATAFTGLDRGGEAHAAL